MKNIIYIALVVLVGISCSKDDPIISEDPTDKTCLLSEKESYTLFPNPQSSSLNLAYFQDSIVELTQYGTDKYRTVYLLNDSDNEITFTQTAEDGSTSLYGTYYLDSKGLRDSTINYRGNNTINSKAHFTRNSANQIIREVIDYTNYGYDTKHFYDSNGNMAYSIYVAFGSLSYNDSLVYEYNMDKINRGAPTYTFQELNGFMSANHITKITHIDRSTGEIRRVRKYSLENFDEDGNPTKTYYDSDNDYNGVFEADYRYEYNYVYACE